MTEKYFGKQSLLTLALVVLLAIVAGIFVSQVTSGKTYTGEDFGIERLTAATDFDEDGVDDYTDFLLGARQDALNHPQYDPAYVAGGYPDDDKGVCTDVIWRAFKQAGYSLKDMIDRDIALHIDDYPNVPVQDKNIDFRRVKNLMVFFSKYAVSLTTDIKRIEEWQPGDIVIFKGEEHIGLVSDIRNRRGRPYIIHNGGQDKREEDYLGRSRVEAHFRFDADLLPGEFLLAWKD